jgi:hypothetical protein
VPLPEPRSVNVFRFPRKNGSLQGVGGEAKSLTTTTTGRSSLNDTTTVPLSARSVSFKEPVVYETFDLPSSHSQQTTAVLAANPDSVLDRIGNHAYFVVFFVSNYKQIHSSSASTTTRISTEF